MQKERKKRIFVERRQILYKRGIINGYEVHKNYSKSARNDNAIEHNKLNKHMMHLLRLYMMGIDILNGKIITYREKEHNLLMDIRNCKYLESDLKTPTKAFEKLVDDYRNCIKY